jgi:hypothetical protein
MTVWQAPSKVSEAGSRKMQDALDPGRTYERPSDVLKDPSLSLTERRAILSAWASDACAVESAPALRQPPFAKRPVTFDEIMDALVQLDRREVTQLGHPSPPYRRPI